MCTIFCDSLYFHEFFFLFVNKCPQDLISRFGNNEFWLLNIEYRFRGTCWNKSLMPCPSMGPKWFWTVQIILVEYKLFGTNPICYGRVQIILNRSKLLKLVQKNIIWTQPKWFGPDQNDLVPTKKNWTVQNHRSSIDGQGIIVVKEIGCCTCMSTIAYFLNDWPKQISYSSTFDKWDFFSQFGEIEKENI